MLYSFEIVPVINLKVYKPLKKSSKTAIIAIPLILSPAHNTEQFGVFVANGGKTKNFRSELLQFFYTFSRLLLWALICNYYRDNIM